jgi:hypothetical protein
MRRRITDEPLPCARSATISLHSATAGGVTIRTQFQCRSVGLGGVVVLVGWSEINIRFVAEAGNRSVQGDNPAVIRRIAFSRFASHIRPNVGAISTLSVLKHRPY